jgi:hypothetical protein
MKLANVWAEVTIFAIHHQWEHATNGNRDGKRQKSAVRENLPELFYIYRIIQTR